MYQNTFEKGFTSNTLQAPPSYSTFGTTGTSKRVGNPSGGDQDFDSGGGKHKAKKAFSSIGHSVGVGVTPSGFLKKTNPSLPDPAKFSRSDNAKRPSVPKCTDKPVLGLTTDKNFVVSNAVDTILAPPKNATHEQKNMTSKRGYGSAPNYLKKIKEELSKEKTIQSQAQEASSAPKDPHLRLLTGEERKALLASLKAKWHQLNQSYQSLTFSMDTVTKVGRKETQETELDRLEKAMNKLSSKYVFFLKCLKSTLQCVRVVK